jgi:glucosamine-6-phosphate deaminase
MQEIPMEIMTQFYVDQLNVRIYPTRDQMGKGCGAEAGSCLRRLLAEKEEVNIIFASAPSQLDALAALREEPEIAWERVNAFHMDEYVGLPAGAPQSFGNYIKTHFFNLVKFKQVFYMNGNAPDLEQECERYAALLRQYPVDISFVGIGENGHLAFNDPHIANFNDPRLVKLNSDMDPTCRQQQVTDGWFADPSLVPQQAITITIPGLMAAQYVYAIVPGPTKQQIVKQCIEWPVGTDCPATILRQHPAAQLYLDASSAALLTPSFMNAGAS